VARSRVLFEGLEDRILLDAVEVQTFTGLGYTPGPVGGNGSWQFTKFDDQNGTRTLVRVYLDVTKTAASGTYVFDNESPFAGLVIEHWTRETINVSSDVPGLAPWVNVLEARVDNQPVVADDDGVPDYLPFDIVSVDIAGVSDTDTLDRAYGVDDLSWFVGPGSITFSFTSSSAAFTNANVDGSTAYTVPLTFDIDATLYYAYVEMDVVKGVIATDGTQGTFSPVPTGPVAFTAPGSPGVRFAGAIHSTNLAADPIDSNLYGVNGNEGPLVSFAIVLENLGETRRLPFEAPGTVPEGLFDVQLRDTLPPGMVVPPGGLNLTVSYGDGTELLLGVGYNLLGGGLFDPAGGLELVDVGPLAGALENFDAVSGRNLVVITYDLQVHPTAFQPMMLDTGTWSNAAIEEGGADLPDLSDPALVTTPPRAVPGFRAPARRILPPMERFFQPLYSGTAEPGATLAVDLYNAQGERIGSQTVVTDVGGNWMANFPDTNINLQPATLVIRQTYAGYNALAGAGYNLRTYFQPAIQGGMDFWEFLTFENVLGKRASVNAMDALYAASLYPIVLGWHAYPYEVLPVTTVAGPG